MSYWKFIILLIVLLGLPLNAAAQSFRRTTLQVERLSCSSCLSRIENELKNTSAIIGMTADLQKHQVIVDHSSDVSAGLLSVVISELGYPAKVINEAVIDDRQVISFDDSAFSRCGSGGCSTGGCSATASAWKELYRRIFNPSQP